MCVGRSVCHVLFSHSSTLFFETQSLTEPGLPIQLGCLTRKSQEPSCLCLPRADLKGIDHHNALLRSWAPALLLRRALSWLSHPLQHPSLFFKLVVRLVIILFSTFLVGSFMVRTGLMWTQCFLNPSGVAPLPNLFSPRHTHMWLPDRSLKVKENLHSSCQGCVSLAGWSGLLMVLRGKAPSVWSSQHLVLPLQATVMFNLESRLLWQISN